MTEYTVNGVDFASVSESTELLLNYVVAEEVVGNFMSNYFTVYYIENQKAIQVDMVNSSAVVYQVNEKYKWIGYGGLQNLRIAEIQSDIRVMNGSVIVNGNTYQSADFINMVVSDVQNYYVRNMTVNNNRVVYIKLKNANNLQMKERGEDWIEFVFEVVILTNNF